MEETISKARRKAESFLLKEVIKISKGISKGEREILYPSDEDTIALRFEAHSYLAHKNKRLKPKYAEELRILSLS